jgi:hypothetical protein
MDILPGAAPLMSGVRHTGSGPVWKERVMWCGLPNLFVTDR